MTGLTEHTKQLIYIATLGSIAGAVGGFGATLPTYAYAEPTILPQSIEDGIFEQNGLRYVRGDDGTATIVGLADSTIQDLVIPETIDGYTVTAIGSNAFIDCGLTSAILPDTVKTIGESAFEGNYDMTAIRLPDSLTTIGESSFAHCRGLESIEIPEGVTEIGHNSFFCCYSLKTLKLPSSTPFIGQHAFSDCTSLQTVAIPYGVTSIGDGAFKDCDNLKKVSIPASVIGVGRNAFKNIALGSTITVQTTDLLNELKSDEYIDLYRTIVKFEEGYPHHAEKIELGDTNLRLNIDGSSTITATVTPFDAEGKVTWKSSDSSVASVSMLGYVYANSGGHATITASIGDVSATCEVSVMDTENLTVSEDDGSFEVNTRISSKEELGWEISDQSVIAPDGFEIRETNDGKAVVGKFFILKPGTTTLRILSGNAVAYEATVTVTPGKKTSISGATISGLEDSYELGTTPITPKPVVALNGTILKEGTDYTLSYENNNEIGTAFVVVTGIGKYEGMAKASFKIVEAQNSLKSATITGIDAEYEWEGKAIKPRPTVVINGKTLSEGSDYILTYKDNSAVGTATISITGKGSYKDSCSTQFRIVDDVRDLASAEISGLNKEYEYEGKALEPKPTVIVDGRTLVEGTDYILAYKDNNCIGTATITVSAKGNYTGTKTLSFRIVDEVQDADETHDLKNATITDLENTYMYTGKIIEPKPTVTLGNNKLTEGVDYTLSYRNNQDVGIATIVITGAGDYQGSKSVTFEIVANTWDEIKFTDVEDGDWFQGPVYTAAANSYMNGYAGTTLFGPYDNITRGQVACVLFNMANGKLGEQYYDLHSFPDVSQGEYYSQAVAWAKASGVVNGYSDGLSTAPS